MSSNKLRTAITGGSSGIGAKVAERLFREGYDVTVFDIVEPKSNVHRWISMDLSKIDSIHSAISESTGPYDTLINNAGLPPREGMADRILVVNYLGFHTFLTRMLVQLINGASIVNTASRAGAMWRENIEQVKALMSLETPEQVSQFVTEQNIDHVRAYNLSKEAVIAFTLSQTEKLIERDIRMNCVSPGAVNTGILDDFKTAFGDRAAKNIARAGRPAESEEVADVIAFLVGNDSRWIKGTDIPVDGGMGAMAISDQFELGCIPI